MARRRKSEPIPLGDLVPSVLVHRGGAVTVSIVTAVWERVLPARIVKNASPTKLKDGVLFVETTTSAWAQELQLMAPTIVQKLRAALPKVPIETLRPKSGPFHRRAPVDTSRPPKVAPLREEELPRELRRELDGLDDADLRAAVTRAARQSLAHKR